MRKALVTGAARGIGRAIADSLRGAGMDVLAPARSDLDLLDPASIDRFVEAHRGAGISVLVNNAGINPIEALGEISAENWARTIQVNLTAPLRLIQGFAAGMAEGGWGRVVNISSIWAVVSKEKRASYSSAKSALAGLTRASSVELAPAGILVNAVCPGFVETELTRANNPPEAIESIRQSIPLGRLARPEEIARLVAFLCSEQNTYITGQSIVIDGGFVSK